MSPRKQKAPSIGDKLRNAREKKGLTQYQVAIAAGVRPETVCRLEAATGDPSVLRSLHKVAHIVGLTVDVLVGKSAGKSLNKKVKK